jgi:hypothetical protein
MADPTDEGGLRERLTRQGEDALGRLAQDLLENPLVTGAISRAFEAREKAVSAQETAMSALNIPSAADLERLTRRLRSVSQRMEGLEEAVDRVDVRLESIGRPPAAGLDERLEEIERSLGVITAELAHLSGSLDAAPSPVPREQERLTMEAGAGEGRAAPAARRRRTSTAKRSASPARGAGPRARKPG